MLRRSKVVVLAVAVAVVANGCTLYGWGRNWKAQLGDGFSNDRHDPTPAQRNPDWLVVDAGWEHSCGIDEQRRMWCWGTNEWGAIGQGSDFSGSYTWPHQVGTATDWNTVSAGSYHTCGTRAAGELWCWGSLVGTWSNEPVRVGTASDWRSISLGHEHACGIRGSGMLWCWGGGGHGQLGYGPVDYAEEPLPISPAGSWTQVSAGYAHTCGIRSPGTLWCWGENGNGQLGDGTDTQLWTAYQIVPGSSDWRKVSTGDNHTCGIRAIGGVQGQLFCWGGNAYGQLGDGTEQDRFLPTNVGYATDWSDIGVGWQLTCGVRSHTETVYCWGRNEFGQVGDGTTTDRSTPTPVSGGYWTSVSVGSEHVLGRRDYPE
jgi:alpha-tubulin suppressor-like RCC1 family protein